MIRFVSSGSTLPRPHKTSLPNQSPKPVCIKYKNSILAVIPGPSTEKYGRRSDFRSCTRTDQSGQRYDKRQTRVVVPTARSCTFTFVEVSGDNTYSADTLGVLQVLSRGVVDRCILLSLWVWVRVQLNRSTEREERFE